MLHHSQFWSKFASNMQLIKLWSEELKNLQVINHEAAVSGYTLQLRGKRRCNLKNLNFLIKYQTNYSKQILCWICIKPCLEWIFEGGGSLVQMIYNLILECFIPQIKLLLLLSSCFLISCCNKNVKLLLNSMLECALYNCQRTEALSKTCFIYEIMHLFTSDVSVLKCYRNKENVIKLLLCACCFLIVLTVFSVFKFKLF